MFQFLFYTNLSNSLLGSDRLRNQHTTGSAKLNLPPLDIQTMDMTKKNLDFVLLISESMQGESSLYTE